MALNSGSVSVADNGAVTGSGCSLEVYNALMAAFSSDLAGRTGDALTASKRGFAKLAQPIAQAVIAHIQANAAVTVNIPTTATGLQTLPTTLAAGQATAGPATAKTLGGSVG